MTTSTRFSRMALTIGALALIGTAAVPAYASAASTSLESKSNSGVKGNRNSSEPSISKNGRFIAFSSYATNLYADDTNGTSDCFVRDTVAKTIERVNVGVAGTCFGPAISPDGNFVAFEAGSPPQIYLRDRNANSTTHVSEGTGGGLGNARSGDPHISNNGRFVVYESRATNLVAGGNGGQEIFLWDRLNPAATKRITNGDKNSHDPAISAWGDYIVFDSLSNLVPRDKNGKKDVYLYDRKSQKTKIISINSAEKLGNGASGNPSVSANGRWVAFESRASNMTSADKTKAMDVFVRDRKNGKTIQVSLSSSGKQGAGWSGDPTISNNGRYIAFESKAPNLVGKDPNNKWDAFLRDRVARTTKILSRRANGKPAYGGDSRDAAISGDGKYVAFESTARKIVLKDTDSVEDIYKRGPLR